MCVGHIALDRESLRMRLVWNFKGTFIRPERDISHQLDVPRYMMMSEERCSAEGTCARGLRLAGSAEWILWFNQGTSPQTMWFKCRSLLGRSDSLKAISTKTRLLWDFCYLLNILEHKIQNNQLHRHTYQRTRQKDWSFDKDFNLVDCKMVEQLCVPMFKWARFQISNDYF